MAVRPQSPAYDLVVRAPSGQELFLRELITALSWEESLDEAAVRLSATLRAGEDVAAGLRGSQGTYLTGQAFGGDRSVELWRGLAWRVDSAERGAPTVNLTAYDPLIYPTHTEDDFLYEAGQSATTIIRHSAAAWGVPVGDLAATAVALERQVHRGATLWTLWTAALRATAKQGGGLYRPRMAGGRLELVALGSNTTVWLLEIGVNIYAAERSWSRDGMVTRAKVVGSAKTDDGPRPILAVYADTDLITAHGTIQRVLSDPDIKMAGAAAVLARQAVRGPEETLTVEAPDINTLRAGDTVVVRDTSGHDYSLLVDRVEHDGSRGPGRMNLTLTTAAQIRRRWIAP